MHTSPRGTFLAEVADNRPLCGAHYLLRLRLKHFPPTRPGQFVQLQCRFPTEQAGVHVVEWDGPRPPRLTQPELTCKEPFLRRPLSLAGRRDTDDGCELDLIYRISGTGTSWLSGVTAGEALSVLGPLGNAFAIRPDKTHAVLIGGGVGIPPMIYLAEAIQKAGKQAAAFLGVRTADRLPVTLVPGLEPSRQGRPTMCVTEFAAHGVAAAVASDDGSLGWGGLVSGAFERWLEERKLDPAALAVYACGPEPMMRAAGEICIARSIDCQLALERHMACGMGTCQSCVVKIRSDTDPGWSFKLCCTDGPVFDARNVVW